MPSADVNGGGAGRRWAEVAVEVHPDAAEAVSALLLDLGAGGVEVRDGVSSGPAEGVSGEAAVALVAYLPEDERLPDRLARLRRGVGEVAQWGLPTGPGRITVRWMDEEDWAHDWKRHYHPFTVGRRFLVRPTWETADPAGRLEIVLDPGMAFGTGRHPTTRQCLELLEEYGTPGIHGADVGTGSGILAIAAALLGAARVAAVDLEPIAVETAEANAVANRVRDRLVLAVGSAETAGRLLGRPADVVMANLTADVLVALRDELVAILAPGGVLVAAGIAAAKEAEAREAFRSAGLVLEKRCHNGEWVALALRREG